MTVPDPSAADDAHVFRARGESVPIDTARLGAYLAGVGLPLDPSEPMLQFGTGMANINYRLTAGGRQFVLRRPPDGDLPPGAHDMAREHRILSRLWKALPLAPQSVHLCEDRDVIGAPFQLIDYRPGLVIKGDDRSRFEGRPDVAARTGDMIIETLVAVHSVDVAAVGLEGLGKPEGFIERGIKGWRGRADRLDLAPQTRRLCAEVGDWLGKLRVAPQPAVLLHSDMKLDNLILAPDTLAPRAIVDWDMGTRGHPLFDLATLLSYWTESRDPPAMHALRQLPTATPGFASRAEVVATYARLTGTDVSDYPGFRVLALFKLAVVLLQLHALWSRGAAKGADYATLDDVAVGLLERTIEEMNGRAA